MYDVNGVRQRISIEEVGIAAEGTGAFMSQPQAGIIRIIDVGSGTVNCATVTDNCHINNASKTFNYGVETSGGRENIDGIARGVIRSTTELKWQRADKVYVCGGVTEELLPLISAHYPAAQALFRNLTRMTARSRTCPRLPTQSAFMKSQG